MVSLKIKIFTLILCLPLLKAYAAGARLSSKLTRDIFVELYKTNDEKIGIIVPVDSTVNHDAGLAGFEGVRWIDCGKTYEVIFTDAKYKKNRIEGTEGWRYWTFLDNGVVEIGPVNRFTPPYGKLQGKLIKSTNCCESVSTSNP